MELLELLLELLKLLDTFDCEPKTFFLPVQTVPKIFLLQIFLFDVKYQTILNEVPLFFMHNNNSL